MTKVIATSYPPQPRGSYIPAALTQYCMNGDAYIPATDAYQICCGGRRVSYSVFQEDLREQREQCRKEITDFWVKEGPRCTEVYRHLQMRSYYFGIRRYAAQTRLWLTPGFRIKFRLEV